MDRAVAEREKCTARMRAAETLGARIVVPRGCIIELSIRRRSGPGASTGYVCQGPKRAEHFGPVLRITHADPGCRQAELIPLADHERFTRPVCDLSERDLAVAIENTG